MAPTMCAARLPKAIVAAMQAKSVPVTYVVYPDEGHGFHKPPNRLSYVAIAEAFFARQLGGEPVGRDHGSSHEVCAGARDTFAFGSLAFVMARQGSAPTPRTPVS
jgi:dienelactone hydrolase